MISIALLVFFIAGDMLRKVTLQKPNERFYWSCVNDMLAYGC